MSKRTVRVVGVVLALLALSPAAMSAERAPIVVDRSVVAVDGVWRFRTGDDPSWASSDLDDSGWATLDLTPEVGAHDGDVGLTSYVPGWTSNGYAGYSGFAWYRTRVSVDAKPGVELALLAPPYVDDAYELYWNGERLGGSGDFSRSVPVAHSTTPQFFELPAASAGVAVIAIRVWMGPTTVLDADSGGVHIAPEIGERRAIEARYQVRWIEVVRGYVVDVVEPILLLMLAALAWILARLETSRRFHAWLVAALVLTAVVRANQAFYSWLPYESLGTFLVLRDVVLWPLGLAAWVLAWRSWFVPEDGRRTIVLVGVLAAAIAATALVGHALAPATVALRLAIGAVWIWVVVSGVARRAEDRWLALVAVLLVATEQYAEELWTVGVPGIWFPFGTGVSRTQFAYAAFVVVLAALLVRRFFRRTEPGTFVTQATVEGPTCREG